MTDMATAVRPVRILMIEDYSHMQTALRELFDCIGGFEVVGSATSESGAVEWMRQHRGQWDIATLDLMLAEGSGFNLIRRLRQHAPRSTTVVLSDFVDPAIERRCVQMGADDVYKKGDAKAFADYLQVIAEQYRLA